MKKLKMKAEWCEATIQQVIREKIIRYWLTVHGLRKSVENNSVYEEYKVVDILWVILSKNNSQFKSSLSAWLEKLFIFDSFLIVHF